MAETMRKAFVLRLKPGALDQYIHWHDNIWPELQEEIARQGIAGLLPEAVEDLEDATLVEEGGARVIVAVSSLERHEGEETADGLVRVAIGADGSLAGEIMPGFRSWLLASYPELSRTAGGPDLLDIQGLIWDPERRLLLFGVRSATATGRPLILPVRVRTWDGPWTTDPEAMCRKTAMRALWKWIPKSPEMAQVEHVEVSQELGRSPVAAFAPEVRGALAQHGLEPIDAPEEDPHDEETGEMKQHDAATSTPASDGEPPANVKLAGERIPSQEIVLARSLVSLVISYGLLRRANVPPWGHDRGGLWLRGLTGFAALSCVYAAVTHLPLADATVIHYLNPAFTALLAGVLLGERISAGSVIATTLCLVGVVLVAKPEALFGAGALTVILASAATFPARTSITPASACQLQ